LEFYDEFDDDYLERLRREDYWTQKHFVAYFSKLLHLKLKSRLRSRQDVEDVQQIIFARFFHNLRKENGIRDAKCLGSYVNSICNNVLLEHYRQRVPDQIDDPIANSIPDPSRNALDTVVDEEAKRIVREILDSLPERDQRILREIFLEERDKDEICKDYGVSRNYLRVLVLRAKNKFREKMLQDPPGPKGKAAD